MKCSKCGTENIEGFKFCGTCGTPLVVPPTTETKAAGMSSGHSPEEIVELGRAKFLTLSCPSCGGKLQITNDIERFACGYCGKEHLVRRGGGIVTLSPVVDGLKRIQQGTDKTASELAILRLSNEIAEMEKNATNFVLRLVTTESLLLLDYYHRNTSYWQQVLNFQPAVDLKKEIEHLSSERIREMIAYYQARSDRKHYEKLVSSLEELRVLYDRLAEKRSQIEKHKRIIGD